MNVLTVTGPDSENGLGCRVTVWVAGCSHHCPGCHNQHTWAYNQGTPLLSDKVLAKIDEQVNKSYIQGITLSGGDPLSQSDASLEELSQFLKQFRAKYPDKNVWIYNGGLFEEDIQNPYKLQVIQQCDVMVDGPFVKELYDPDIAFRGSSNQRIIDIQKSICSKKVVEIEIP